MRMILTLALVALAQDPPRSSKSTWGRWAPGTTVKYQLTNKVDGDSEQIETLVKVGEDSCHTKWTLKTGSGTKEIERKYIYVDERPTMNPDAEELDEEKITLGTKEYACRVIRVKKDDDERTCILTEWIIPDVELPLRRTYSVKSKIQGKNSTFRRDALVLDEVIEVGKQKVKCTKYKDRTEVVPTPGAKPEVTEETTWHSAEVPGFLVKHDDGRTVKVVVEFEAKK